MVGSGNPQVYPHPPRESAEEPNGRLPLFESGRSVAVELSCDRRAAEKLQPRDRGHGERSRQEQWEAQHDNRDDSDNRVVGTDRGDTLAHEENLN